MGGACSYFVEYLLELSLEFASGLAYGQSGGVPDDMRDMPFVPELELRPPISFVPGQLQQLPFGCSADAAQDIRQPFRHALPELPYLPVMAAGQFQPFVLDLPDEPRGLLSLFGLPPGV